MIIKNFITVKVLLVQTFKPNYPAVRVSSTHQTKYLCDNRLQSLVNHYLNNSCLNFITHTKVSLNIFLHRRFENFKQAYVDNFVIVLSEIYELSVTL